MEKSVEEGINEQDRSVAYAHLLKILKLQQNLLAPTTLDGESGTRAGEFIAALHRELAKLQCRLRVNT